MNALSDFDIFDDNDKKKLILHTQNGIEKMKKLDSNGIMKRLSGY